MKKISLILSETAKYLFIAAVAASFVFIGWRICTKRSYDAQEKLQCRVLAASAAVSAADALQWLPELTDTVQKERRPQFIADHMRMPGNYVVSVSMTATEGMTRIEASASSGWNSRSPQNEEFVLDTDAGGKRLYKNERDKTLAETLEFLKEKDETFFLKNKRLVFTYPFEKPCPSPFSANAAESRHFSEAPVVLLFFAK